MRKNPNAHPPLPAPIPEAVLKAEVASWANAIGVEPAEIRLRPMIHKWASCSSRGRLTFDTGLLSQPLEFRSRAIVHELLHLRVPNHGKLFQSLLRSYLATAS